MNGESGFAILALVATVLGKGLALCAIVFVISWMGGQRVSAAFHRALWIACMAGLLLLPLLEGVVPRVVSLPVLKSEVANIAETPVAVERMPALGTTTEAMALGAEGSPEIKIVIEQPAEYSTMIATAPQEVDLPLTTAGAAMRPGEVQRLRWWEGISASMWVVFVWGLGVVILSGRLLVAQARLRGLARNAVPMAAESGEWPETHWADRLAKAGLTPRTRLLWSGTFPLPVTWGVFRPVILLPSAVRELSGERREAVLQHELQHIAARDSWALLAGNLATVIHWPNPLAWMALRRLRRSAELACDDAVLRSGAARADTYAELLLSIAGNGRRREKPFTTGPLAVTMAQRSNLKQRITSILNPDMNRKILSRRTRLLLGCGAGATITALSALGWAESAATAAPGDSISGQSAGPLPTAPAQDAAGIVVPDSEALSVPPEALGFSADGTTVWVQNTPNEGTDTGDEAAGYLPAEEVSPNVEPRSVTERKLREIVVSEVEFLEVPLPDAIEYLAEASRVHDIHEPDPDQRGLNFVILKEAQDLIAGNSSQQQDLAKRIEKQQERVDQARKKLIEIFESASATAEGKEEEATDSAAFSAGGESSRSGAASAGMGPAGGTKMSGGGITYSTRRGTAFVTSRMALPASFEDALIQEEQQEIYNMELEALRQLQKESVAMASQDRQELPAITLSLRNVPLGELLKYVAQLGGIGFEVQEHAVVFGTPVELEQFRHGASSGGAGATSGLADPYAGARGAASGLADPFGGTGGAASGLADPFGGTEGTGYGEESGISSGPAQGSGASAGSRRGR